MESMSRLGGVCAWVEHGGGIFEPLMLPVLVPGVWEEAVCMVASGRLLMLLSVGGTGVVACSGWPG